MSVKEVKYYEVRKFHPFDSRPSWKIEGVPAYNTQKEAEEIARERASTPAQQYLGFVHEVYEVIRTERPVFNTAEGRIG